jgi:hypothetical protein
MMARKSSVPASGVFVLALSALFLQVQVAPAQDQPTVSVADAARAAREQKQSEKPVKVSKVYTDDDIANLKGSVSVIGAPATPETPDDGTAKADDGTAKPADGTAKADDGTAKPADSDAKPTPKDEASWRRAFAEARRKLADDSKELDVLQREYNLKLEQYYTDPNVAMREQNSSKDLHDSLDKINAKKMDVQADTDAISALEDDLRKAGGDPGWAREPNS